jgi:hypothetical protein
MVENSLGYRIGEAFEPGKELRPAWTNGPPSRTGTQDGVTGTFFIGTALVKPDIEQASSSAEGDANRQISKHIGVNIKTVIHDFQSDVAAQAYVDSWQKSATSFSGARRTQNYWERIGKKQQFTVNYWVEYFISETQIKEAQEKFEKIQDVEDMERDVFKNQEKLFAGIKRRLEIHQNTDADYNDLLEIKTRLHGLGTLQLNPSDGPVLTKLIDDVRDAISETDPLKKIIMLEARASYFQGQAEMLKNMLTSNRSDELKRLEDTIRSQPGASSEIRSPVIIITSVYLKGVYIADKAVSIENYVTFLIERRGNHHKFEGKTENKPVTDITWIEAAKYCNWLNQSLGYTNYYEIVEDAVEDTIRETTNPNANGYRLPTVDEINAGIDAGIIKHLDMNVFGLWCNKGSIYDLKGKTLVDRPLKKDVNTGFIVVRHAR